MKGKLLWSETLEEKEKQTYSRIPPPSTIGFLFFSTLLRCASLAKIARTALLTLSPEKSRHSHQGCVRDWRQASVFHILPSIHKVICHHFTDAGKQSVTKQVGFMTPRNQFSSYLGERQDLCLQCFLSERKTIWTHHCNIKYRDMTTDFPACFTAALTGSLALKRLICLLLNCCT